MTPNLPAPVSRVKAANYSFGSSGTSSPEDFKEEGADREGFLWGSSSVFVFRAVLNTHGC